MDDRMTRKPYESDLVDEEWRIVQPLLPECKFGGRPRTTNIREVLNAIFYLLRTGCAWRLLPHDFPPAGTVFEQSGAKFTVTDAEPQKVTNDTRFNFTGTAFHPSNRYLAVTSNDETVKLYDTTTWEQARAFTWKIGKLRSVCFSSDGALAAAGSNTGKVVVWDVDL